MGIFNNNKILSLPCVVSASEQPHTKHRNHRTKTLSTEQLSEKNNYSTLVHINESSALHVISLNLYVFHSGNRDCDISQPKHSISFRCTGVLLWPSADSQTALFCS